MKPFQPKSSHKIVSDVHANTKYYYPEEFHSLTNDYNRQKDMEWNNRANNIIYNTMRNNWNEDDLKLSDNINQMRAFDYNMNKQNNMNNSNLSNSNRNDFYRNDTFGNNQNMMNNMNELNSNYNNLGNNSMLNANRNYLSQNLNINNFP